MDRRPEKLLGVAAIAVATVGVLGCGGAEESTTTSGATQPKTTESQNTTPEETLSKEEKQKRYIEKVQREAKEELAKAKELLKNRPTNTEQASSSGVVVRVTGTPGLPFQGSYGNVGGQQSVQGVTPAEYPISLQGGFDVVSAAFQKQDASDAVLRVEIVSGGSVVESRETSAAYGVVTATKANP